MATDLVPVDEVSESRAVALIEGAERSLAEAVTLADNIDVGNKAEAVRQYLKQSRASLALQNRAAEVRLRSQRNAGKMLAKMEKKSNQHGGNTTLPTLAEMGIEKIQSSRYQRIASLSQIEFERHIKETTEAEKELTAASVLKLARPGVNGKPTVKVHQHDDAAETCNELPDLAGRKFGTIYADPPWQYGNQATRASTDNHYQTMSVADLCAMPVKELAADDAHLHLWTTNGFLREAFSVLDAWGFEYRSVFVWCKPQMGIGNYWRVSHEFLLLGIRGDAKQFADHSQKSWMEFDRGKHSAKPEQIRSIIELVSPGPYLELFGRCEIGGWTVFGNQVEKRLFA